MKRSCRGVVRPERRPAITIASMIFPLIFAGLQPSLHAGSGGNKNDLGTIPVEQFLEQLSEDLEFYQFYKRDVIKNLSRYDKDYSRISNHLEHALKSENRGWIIGALALMGLLGKDDQARHVRALERKYADDIVIQEYIGFYYYKVGINQETSLTKLLESVSRFIKEPLDAHIIVYLGFINEPDRVLPVLIDMAMTADGAPAETISESIDWLFHNYPDRSLDSIKKIYDSGNDKVREMIFHKLKWVADEGNEDVKAFLKDARKE